MERPGFLIVQEGPIDTSNSMYAKIKVHAVLVKDDDAPVGSIPRMLKRNGITLGPDEKFKTILGLRPPENLKASLSELCATIEADPGKKEAAEWLLAHTYQAGFETGAGEGTDAFCKKHGLL